MKERNYKARIWRSLEVVDPLATIMPLTEWCNILAIWY